MEKLTETRFDDTDRMQAWCPMCKKWIDQVGVSLDCFTRPGKKVIKYVDYVYCQECNTAIARSD